MKLALCPSTWSVLVNNPYALINNVYSIIVEFSVAYIWQLKEVYYKYSLDLLYLYWFFFLFFLYRCLKEVVVCICPLLYVCSNFASNIWRYVKAKLELFNLSDGFLLLLYIHFKSRITAPTFLLVFLCYIFSHPLFSWTMLGPWNILSPF